MIFYLAKSVIKNIPQIIYRLKNITNKRILTDKRKKSVKEAMKIITLFAKKNPPHTGQSNHPSLFPL